MADVRDAEWVDAQLERLAIAAGAEPVQVPRTLAGPVLERCGHFESFPGLAIPSSPAGDYHAPAACFHVYSDLEGQRLRRPRCLTLVAACGRNERVEEPGRLRHFTMREVVFLGPADWVTRMRDEWMDRASGFASALGLAAALEPATDAFFGAPGRGQRLIQQLKASKYELRAQAGAAGSLAIASFNLHESFFTRRFGISIDGVSPAASGCAAFGIERWVLACNAQRHASLR